MSYLGLDRIHVDTTNSEKNETFRKKTFVQNVTISCRDFPKGFTRHFSFLLMFRPDDVFQRTLHCFASSIATFKLRTRTGTSYVSF